MEPREKLSKLSCGARTGRRCLARRANEAASTHERLLVKTKHVRASMQQLQRRGEEQLDFARGEFTGLEFVGEVKDGS